MIFDELMSALAQAHASCDEVRVLSLTVKAKRPYRLLSVPLGGI